MLMTPVMGPDILYARPFDRGALNVIAWPGPRTTVVPSPKSNPAEHPGVAASSYTVKKTVCAAPVFTIVARRTAVVEIDVQAVADPLVRAKGVTPPVDVSAAPLEETAWHWVDVVPSQLREALRPLLSTTAS